MRVMRVIKKIGIVSLLIVAAALVQNATAFPTSTFAEENGWAGYRFYKEDNFDLVVSWTVYDIDTYPAEFKWAEQMQLPPGDQYVYAYVIYSNPLTKDTSDDVETFRVLDIAGERLPQSLIRRTMGVPLEDPVVPGVLPDPNVSVEQGAWEWPAQIGFFPAGERSSYLIFSSDQPPTRGTFEVSPPSEPNTPIHPTIPEPGTVALLVVGSSVLIARRRKKRQAR